MHDVIVVGAGPAGNLAAKTLADKKYEVLVLEDHERSGIPQHCTGLVSDEALKLSGVKPDIINTLYNCEFNFPNGETVTLRSEMPKGRLIDRASFDAKMADRAINAGADYCYQEAYKSHTVGESVIVDTSEKPHRAKVIVGADGASSKVAMSLGDNEPREYVRGLQADIKLKMEDQETFKVYLGNHLAPGFFAWAIPCGDYTRVGLCVEWAAGPASNYLSDLLIHLGVEDKVMKVYSGKIPLGGRPYISGDRCLLTGDAAGFVKPLSGGGLYPTFRANQCLTDVLAAGLDTDAVYARDLSDYDRQIKNVIGRELDHAYKLRQKFKKLSDADFNKICEFVQKNDLEADLGDMDIDHPSDVAKKLMHKPKLILSALPLYLRTVG
jgi:geranylgeranyl reductase family protein